MSSDPDESQAFVAKLNAVREGATRDADKSLRAFEPVSDAVLLAAVDRAERHSLHYARGQRGTVMSQLKAHLAFRHNGATTRKLAPQMDKLVADGSLRTTRRHVVCWALTERGHRRLARARQYGDIALPEAPQHRQWRHARQEAPGLLQESGEALAATLAQAVALLDADRARADDWLDMRQRLDRECRHIASAIFCLREWPEPGDAHLDVKRRPELSDPAALRFRS